MVYGSVSSVLELIRPLEEKKKKNYSSIRANAQTLKQTTSFTKYAPPLGWPQFPLSASMVSIVIPRAVLAGVDQASIGPELTAAMVQGLPVK